MYFRDRLGHNNKQTFLWFKPFNLISEPLCRAEISKRFATKTRILERCIKVWNCSFFYQKSHVSCNVSVSHLVSSVSRLFNPSTQQERDPSSVNSATSPPLHNPTYHGTNVSTPERSHTAARGATTGTGSLTRTWLLAPTDQEVDKLGSEGFHVGGVCV